MTIYLAVLGLAAALSGVLHAVHNARASKLADELDKLRGALPGAK